MEAAALASLGLPAPRLWRALDATFFVTGSLVFFVGALYAKPVFFGDAASGRPRVGCSGEGPPPSPLEPADPPDPDEAAALGAGRARLREASGRLMGLGLVLLGWTLVLDRVRRAAAGTP